MACATDPTIKLRPGWLEQRPGAPGQRMPLTAPAVPTASFGTFLHREPGQGRHRFPGQLDPGARTLANRGALIHARAQAREAKDPAARAPAPPRP